MLCDCDQVDDVNGGESGLVKIGSRVPTRA